MTDPTQQAMEQAVQQARAQLADGALVQGTLEHLWRIAFAAGVRIGQSAQPSARSWTGATPGLAPLADGWVYGSAAHVQIGVAGTKFSYGGTDRMKPACDRAAVMVGRDHGALKMTLADTGETVRVPVMCWIRFADAGDPDVRA